jgi:hypothetical protein
VDGDHAHELAHLRDGGVEAQRLGDAGVEVHQLPEAVVAEEARELRHASRERLLAIAAARDQRHALLARALRLERAQLAPQLLGHLRVRHGHVREPRQRGRRRVPPGDHEVEHHVAEALVVPEPAAILAQLDEPRQDVVLDLIVAH